MKIFWLMVALALVGCNTVREEGSREGFGVGDIAKSDIDNVTDLAAEALFADLRDLTAKLYRRNPRFLQRAAIGSVEAGVARIFGPQGRPTFRWEFPELEGKRGADAVRLAFRADYPGDRVLAFAAGLGAMLHASYGGKTDFYLFDELDAQKLYNSARNLEIAAWMLRDQRDAAGAPYLLSNAVEGEVINLSFERLFGKMIARQDLMSRIVEQQTHRTVKRVIQSLATAVFMPI